MEELNKAIECLSSVAEILGIQRSGKQLESLAKYLLRSLDLEQLRDCCDRLTKTWQFSYFPKPTHFLEHKLPRKLKEKSGEFCFICKNTGVIHCKESGLPPFSSVEYEFAFRCNCSEGNKLSANYKSLNSFVN